MIPRIIFIVPYRNRVEHKQFFTKYMEFIMEDYKKEDFETYFVHQRDNRPFNRGAMKNIGFLAIKQKYPNHYKDITFVFNDVDTMPTTKDIIDYNTVHGVFKHYYGFQFALGGIFSIKGADFEKSKGFPNFWGWGMEDNVLQKRCEKYNLTINRTNFYKIGSQNIIHLFDGVSRIINQKDPHRATHDNGIDGISTINGLEYTIDELSDNPIDNLHSHTNTKRDNIFYINIKRFLTSVRFESDNYHNYDLREPPRKILHPNKIKTKVINHVANDWSNIPYYPNSNTKNKMVQKYGYEKTEEFIENNLKKSLNSLNSIDTSNSTAEDYSHDDINSNIETFKSKYNLLKIKKINQFYKENNSDMRIIPEGINKYSREYAQYIVPKRRICKSANIRLGGVY